MTGRIYLDMDGVLADFDTGAAALLNTDDIHKWEFVHGPKAFWERLDAYPMFFASLPPMPDAHLLWQAVRHTNPVILTALPRQGAENVAAQKRAWIDIHLGTEVEVITCLTHEKPNFCNPGDVLVDDRAVNREAWHAKGGKFVLHTSAKRSLIELAALGYLST